MALNSKENGRAIKTSYLSPIPAVKDFFECLGELKNLSKSPSQSQAGRLAFFVWVCCWCLVDCPYLLVIPYTVDCVVMVWDILFETL